MKTNAKRFSGALACILILLSGCATVGKPPEEAVVERAQARWDALLAGDMTAAYSYLSPGYRSAVSLNDWQRRVFTQRVTWTGARVIESECEEETCKVQISLDYVIVGALRGVSRYERTSRIDEDWILSDGQWFHVPAG